MAKRFNARGLKKHHSYTIAEAAEALGAHPQTVRAWIRNGLPVLADKTPHLILGDHIQTYLRGDATRRRTPLGPDELYCLSCRSAKIPAGMMADFVEMALGQGRLAGICPDCEGMCNRFALKSRLSEIAPGLAVEFRSAESSLREPEEAT